MNTPVDFTTAQLLKEKGFDEIVRGRYTVTHWNSAFKIGDLFYSDYPINDHCAYAPTIADVVMWLYEKHGIWITVCVIGADGFGYWLHNKNRKRLNPEDQGGYWYSPTEAYEAAIKYVLEKLI